MKRVIGGLAIAVPAYGVLASTGSAKAATPQACSGSCPPHLIDQWCAGSGITNPGNTSCKGPDVAACMQDWQPGGIKQEGWCFEP